MVWLLSSLFPAFSCVQPQGVSEGAKVLKLYTEVDQIPTECSQFDLFFLQRTNRIPKDIHVEPERFAAELIGRLEGILKEREAREQLEERLKRVRLVIMLFYFVRLKAQAESVCS